MERRRGERRQRRTTLAAAKIRVRYRRTGDRRSGRIIKLGLLLGLRTRAARQRDGTRAYGTDDRSYDRRARRTKNPRSRCTVHRPPDDFAGRAITVRRDAIVARSSAVVVVVVVTRCIIRYEKWESASATTVRTERNKTERGSTGGSERKRGVYFAS